MVFQMKMARLTDDVQEDLRRRSHTRVTDRVRTVIDMSWNNEIDTLVVIDLLDTVNDKALTYTSDMIDVDIPTDRPCRHLPDQD